MRFTRNYRIELLVYLEMHDTMPDAIPREKQIMKWNGDWKIA